MQQTGPYFVIRKYRSIFIATAIVEIFNYVVSLTDSIVAGNTLGSGALAAIGLISPLLAVSTFLSSVVNSGTVRNFSFQIGLFDERRAREIFSQGFFFALALGVVYAGTLFVLKGPVLEMISAPGVCRGTQERSCASLSRKS